MKQLVERGRTTTEHVVSLIQSEVSKQLGKFAQRLDDVEARVEDVASNFGLGSKSAAKKAPAAVVRPAAAPARKKAAKKKAPAKKAAIEEGTGEEGCRSVRRRQGGRQEAPAKKAPAKK